MWVLEHPDEPLLPFKVGGSRRQAGDTARSRRLVTLAMAVDAAVPHPAMAVDDLAPVEVLRPTDEGEAAA